MIFNLPLSSEARAIVSLSYLKIDLQVVLIDLRKVSKSDSGLKFLNKSVILFEFV